MKDKELIETLDRWAIPVRRYEHPAVFTCEEAAVHLKHVPGIGTKNLFLSSEKKANPYLLIVDEKKRVDINRLGKQLGLGKLRFGSPEKLESYLGIKPGSVTLLAIINDQDHRVSVLIDRDLWGSDAIQCHPLINTATLVLSTVDLEKFLQFTGHAYQLIDIPVRGIA